MDADSEVASQLNESSESVLEPMASTQSDSQAVDFNMVSCTTAPHGPHGTTSIAKLSSLYYTVQLDLVLWLTFI